MPILSESLPHDRLHFAYADVMFLFDIADSLEDFTIDETQVLDTNTSDTDMGPVSSCSRENDHVEKPKLLRERKGSRRQMYRQYLKSIPEELRQQVGTLKEKLSRVKEIKEIEKTRFDAKQTPEFWFWQSVAIHERNKRSLAEEKQQKLRSTVNTQASYIKALCDIARQQGGESGICINSIYPTSLPDEQLSEEMEAAVLDAFIQELDVDYASAKHMEVGFSL